MFERELATTAAAMVAAGKGILAIDASSGTIKKRFDSIHLESSVENRRAYRDLLITGNGLSQNISGMILYDETSSRRARRQTVSRARHCTPQRNERDGRNAAVGAVVLSRARALQAPALNSWRDHSANVPAAQRALFHRAKLNSAACCGRYKTEMEQESLAA